jgi:diadenosine tetraphosphate (Ap4A) HIT family hydrolase
MTDTRSIGSDQRCFLCSPDPALVYASDGSGIALCGLGPLVTGYSLVATRKHVRSAADAMLGEAPDFLSFAVGIRRKLSARFGSCLMTEHGRVHTCIDVSGTTDPHCYHAHFLLFPAAPRIEDQALEHFAKAEEAPTLIDAMRFAAQHEEYFFFSPSPDRFLVLTRPGKLVRQFARFLVADALDASDLANWRRFPSFDEAANQAAELKLLTLPKGEN